MSPEQFSREFKKIIAMLTTEQQDAFRRRLSREPGPRITTLRLRQIVEAVIRGES